MIRSYIYANRCSLRLSFIVLISIFLNGCAVMASAPIPLRIVSNIHSGYSVYKNLDENPENDSWYMGYIKSIFGKEKEEVLFVFEDKDTIIQHYENPAVGIRL